MLPEVRKAPRRRGHGTSSKDNPFPCVIGDRFPHFCDKRFLTIEKHNEHLKRFHSPTFWCPQCLHKFNSSSTDKPLTFDKADHARNCSGKPSKQNRERRERFYVMSEAQYDRFKEGNWKTTEVSVQSNDDGSEESLPRKCWRQVRETLFPSWGMAGQSPENIKANQSSSEIMGLHEPCSSDPMTKPITQFGSPTTYLAPPQFGSHIQHKLFGSIDFNEPDLLPLEDHSWQEFMGTNWVLFGEQEGRGHYPPPPVIPTSSAQSYHSPPLGIMPTSNAQSGTAFNEISPSYMDQLYVSFDPFDEQEGPGHSPPLDVMPTSVAQSGHSRVQFRPPTLGGSYTSVIEPDQISTTYTPSIQDTCPSNARSGTLSSAPTHPIPLPSDSGYESMKRGAGLALSLPHFQEQIISNEDDGDSDDFDETATTYSVALSISEGDLDTYKSELSETLLNNIRQRDPATESLEALEEALPFLLRSFALRLGSPGSTKTEKEIMYFVHKHRKDIASRFHNAVKDIRDQEVIPERQQEAIEKLDIGQWLRDLGGRHNQEISISSEIIEEEIEEQLSLVDRRGYRDAVFNSVAYKWLMAALHKSLALTPVQEDDVCTHIRHQISECLEQDRSISSRKASKRYSMDFSADWDPAVFLQQQFEDSSDLGRLLGESLTLTGSITDAQALPCAEYLLQTWPSIGSTLLNLLKAALVSKMEVYGELEDKSTVRCQFINSRLETQVQGSVDSIATICELLGWIGAAVRPSCSAWGLARCRPHIHISTPVTGPARCIIYYTVVPVTLEPQDSKRGQCWHAIFHNPVIAAGYPVPRRNRYGSGLEIPLNIMAGLTKSPRVHKYMGRHFLKGYSIALVPTEKLDDMMLWHLYYSEDGSRLPYPELDDMDYTGLELHDLTAGRHVVGWCSQAKFFAGAPSMNYAIKTSQLERPGREFALEKVSLSIGQLVTGGCQFAIGRKDCHVRINRGSYKAKLQWLDQKYVTLWDVAEERGWLVNGTAALLHLLRASLAHSKADKFNSEFLFREDQFQESQKPGSVESVLDVLLSHTNQKLELYPKDDYSFQETKLSSDGQFETVTKTVISRTTVKDRVEELYETLEKLFDHNATSEASYKGINAKPRLQDHLEGWDFMDIATDRDPFFLRRAKLPLSLLGWVDFTKAIPAITLFGNGFGDMIRASEVQPTSRRTACSDWETVPKYKNLLCVSTADLRGIIDRIGDQETAPITVAPGILWLNPATTTPFHRNCSCDPKGKSLGEPDHHAVQKLVSSKLRLFFSNSVVDLDSHQNGAVIFGSPDRRLYWGSSSATRSSMGESSSSVPLGNSDTSHQPDTSNSPSRSPYTPASVTTESQDMSASGASIDNGSSISHSTPAVDQTSTSQVSNIADQTSVSSPGSQAASDREHVSTHHNQGETETAVRTKRKILDIPTIVASIPKRLKRC